MLQILAGDKYVERSVYTFHKMNAGQHVLVRQAGLVIAATERRTGNTRVA